MNNHQEDMCSKGLMADPLKSGSGYPGGSRDFWMIELPCGATSCVCNSNGKCCVPSNAKIGKNGKCEGFRKRKVTKG